MNDINKKIILYISIVGIIAMSILAPIAYFITNKKTEKILIQSIEENVHIITKELNLNKINQIKNQFLLERIKTKINKLFLSKNIIYFTMRDQNGNFLYNYQTDEYEGLNPDTLEFKRNTNYKRYEHNGVNYVHLTQTYNNNNTIEIVSEINNLVLEQVYFTTSAVVLAVIIGELALLFALYPIIKRLNTKTMQFSENLLASNLELLEVLGSSIAKRDSDTNEHNYRVTLYSIRLAETLKIDKKIISSLIAGAFLHDVGKIGIPDRILLKPGKLDEEEFKIMKTHVTLGVDIVQKSAWLENARKVVEYHHEKYDGSGYMKGLKGEEIPIEARIFAIVDVFDALTSKRPYKDPFSIEKSFKILNEGSGKHFDPHILKVFQEHAPRWHKKFSSLSSQHLEKGLRHYIVKYYFQADNKYES